MNGSLRVKTVKRLNLYERFKRIRVRMKYNDAYINDASPLENVIAMFCNFVSIIQLSHSVRHTFLHFFSGCAQAVN